jgi:hypothetical protein
MLATKPMTRRKRAQPLTLMKLLRDYSWENNIKFYNFNNGVHVRLAARTATLDIWPTTGHYYVLATDFVIYDLGIIERQGEKGTIPSNDQLFTFLDKLFFAGDWV